MEGGAEHMRLVEVDPIRDLLQEVMACKGELSDKGQVGLEARLEDCLVLLRREVMLKVVNLEHNQVSYMSRLVIGLSELSDQLFLLLSAEGLTDAYSAGLTLLSNGLNRIFDFLLSEFDDVFNFQLRVPLLVKLHMESVLESSWDKLTELLLFQEVDPELIALLKGYELEMKGRTKQNFGQLRYIEVVVKGLLELDCSKRTTEHDGLLSFFCYVNFNYYPLVQYYIGKFQRDYDKVESYREEYIKLTVLLRSLNQSVVRPNFGFDLGVEGFQGVLVNVLEKEISCVKKLLNMNLKALGNSGAKFLLHQFYFRISVSMEQFLFLFRLLIDKEVVLVKRKADLYEFIHSHVGTLRKDNLSVGNMQNTYGENNRMTAIRVRALLQSLITHIDEKYL
ncbi:MAG: hypothetical protein EOO88_52760 [Pedobacter sp.]|nr:MAG: hypothetical protein EOO88_52760 [Pedobacter sp.]